MKKEIRLGNDTKNIVLGLSAVVEILALTVFYYLMWKWAYSKEVFIGLFEYNGKYVLLGLYAAIGALLIKITDGFKIGSLPRIDLMLAQWIDMVITNIITYFHLCLIANRMITPVPMILLTVADLIICSVFVVASAAIYSYCYAPYHAVMVYGNHRAAAMKLKLETRREKYRIDKLVSADEGLDAICAELVKYDTVIVNDLPSQLRNDILKFCYEHEIRMYMVPKITDLMIRGARPVKDFDTPMLAIPEYGLSAGQRFVKRTMDIVLSVIGIVITWPIMAAIAIAIKCEDGGPIFYKQKRATVGNREFEVLKFRSMVIDAEKNTGAVLAAEDDPRVTKVGRFIRAIRLDELPQLLNILKGDMSVVGPRPERKAFIDEFCREMPEFSYRTKVKAGLTGYAQIYGKYNTIPYDKLRLDMIYISNYSLFLDIKLIFTTVRILFNKEKTEGIDVAQETQRKTDELLEEIQQEGKKNE